MVLQKDPTDIPLAKMVSYAEIALQMRVNVETVRIYAIRDEDFPKPITPASFRSPGFNQDDVDLYIEKRATKNVGKSGRPPRIRPGQDEPGTDAAKKPAKAPTRKTEK